MIAGGGNIIPIKGNFMLTIGRRWGIILVWLREMVLRDCEVVVSMGWVVVGDGNITEGGVVCGCCPCRVGYL